MPKQKRLTLLLMLASSTILLAAILYAGWWGWQNSGLALLELGLGSC